jgi:hypothetical protein
MKTIAWICTLLALVGVAMAGTNGTTFFVIGDYGVVTSMATPNMVFDAMDGVVAGAANNTIGNPEFFVACGDNIYPKVANAPTELEFETMLSLFERPNIKDLPVYAIRGNHDSYFNWTYELELSMEQT